MEEKQKGISENENKKALSKFTNKKSLFSRHK